MMKSLYHWKALIIGFLICCCGCIGYRFGPTTNIEHARTICVMPFTNDTYEPGLTEPVTAAVRKRLQQDGTLRVVRNPDADIVLTGTIIDYVRRGLSFSPEDVRTPRDYEIRITAHVTAYRQTNGKQLIEQKVTARAAVRVVGDQASAERELLPILADDLARQICSLVVDGSW